MTAPFMPLSETFYSIPKAQILWKPKDADQFVLLGDSDEVTLDIAVEETDRYTNETGIRELAKTIITQVDATLNLTLVQLSDVNRALSMLGLLQYDTQAGVTDHEIVISADQVPHDGGMYQLEHFDLVEGTVVVTDNTIPGVAYVEGTNYKIDLDAGILQLLSIPVGANGTVKISYDAQTIAAEDKRARIGVGSKSDNRGTIIIRGTNDVGPRRYLQLHDVLLRPDGSINFVSATDLDTITLVGRVFRDDTQVEGQKLGFERSLASSSVPIST